MAKADGSDAPYLSLSVTQAAVLLKPEAPEPVDHGTFLALLQHRAKHQADHIAAGFPSLGGKGCQTFTYSQLLSSSQRISQQLSKHLEYDADCTIQPVIAIIGLSGPDFLLHVVASWLLGAAILPIAIGTPPNGAANLIRLCEANALLYSKDQSETVQAIRQILDEQKYTNATFIEWVQESVVNGHSHSNGTLEQHRITQPSDTLVTFHSSGSSGNPKPISQFHRFWSTTLLNAPGRQYAAYTTTPLFHGGLSDFFRSAQAGASLYFYPWHEQAAPTLDNIIQSVRACDQEIYYFLSVPFILEVLFKSSKGIEILQKMHLVSTGGAPLPESIGDKAVKEDNIKLVSRLGSSECGFLMSSYRDFCNDKEWSWLRLPDQLGQSLLYFEAQDGSGEDDVFELVVSPQWPNKQLSNRSDGSFATGDLYQRHPTHQDRWRYKRRADDNIVMINGKKIAASMIESYLCESPLVDDVIVFGANRALLGAIIFPSSKSTDDATIRRQIRPHLLSTNRRLPGHGRIAMEMIHIGDDKLKSSLPRSSKGTLQKGMALEKLQSLIDGMYDAFERGEAPSTEERKTLKGNELTSWLLSKVEEISDGKIGLEDDFYRAGIDSIMAAKIRAAVHQGLYLDDFRLKASDVYDHPSVTSLSRYIDSRGKDSDQDRGQVMTDLVEKYAQFSPLKAKDDAHQSNEGKVVILTGATGALGCRILHELVKNVDVQKVICMVRADDSATARKRVKVTLEDKGLDIPDGRWDCVTSLWELSMKKETIQASQLTIIHCAWIVNFALRVESFEKDCIGSLKDLLDFFRSCSNASKFIFCSSLASILGGHSPYQEVSSNDPKDSGQTGYGQSKWIAEKICEKAGPKVFIARIGQLCGDTERGIWNTSEAWPLMIKTAEEIGCLPNTGPSIDWLPVDTAARGIVDIALLETTSISRHVHVALPPQVLRPSWQTFLQWLKEGELQFKSISKQEWMELIKSKRGQIRGSALIDIWKSIPEDDLKAGKVEMRQSMAHSSTLSSAKAVDKDLTIKMIKAWKSTGFLSNK